MYVCVLYCVDVCTVYVYVMCVGVCTYTHVCARVSVSRVRTCTCVLCIDVCTVYAHVMCVSVCSYVSANVCTSTSGRGWGVQNDQGGRDCGHIPCGTLPGRVMKSRGKYLRHLSHEWSGTTRGPKTVTKDYSNIYRIGPYHSLP